MNTIKAGNGFASLVQDIGSAIFAYLTETLGLSRSTVSIAFFAVIVCIAALLVIGYLKYGRK